MINQIHTEYAARKFRNLTVLEGITLLRCVRVQEKIIDECGS
ncbi:hypothetical protein [Caudoviricetes sp.]|nr:hypothetical protein [Caudoviricetes sp.]